MSSLKVDPLSSGGYENVFLRRYRYLHKSIKTSPSDTCPSLQSTVREALILQIDFKLLMLPQYDWMIST